MRRHYPTLDDITRAIECRCATCKGPAKIYPYPEGQGTCVCPNCSPVWLGSFVEFGTARLREELASRLKRTNHHGTNRL